MTQWFLWLKAFMIVPALVGLVVRGPAYYLAAPLRWQLMLAYVAVVSAVSAIALWQWRKGHKGWAVASEILFVPLCLFCIFGAIKAYREWRKGPEEAPAAPPADLTKKKAAEQAANRAGVAGAVFLLASGQLTRYGDTHALPVPGWIEWFALLAAAVFVNILLHEVGHALGGWSAGFRLYRFQAGPFVWKISDGHWRFRLEARGATGGQCAMVPVSLDRLAPRMARFIAGGPAATFSVGVTALGLALAAPGSWWQPAWNFLGLTGLIGLVLLFLNLYASSDPYEVTDGVHLRRLREGGGWAHLLAARSQVASSLVTPLRPRDYDTALLARAAAVKATPPELAANHMFQFLMYWDRSEPIAALACLDQAAALIDAAEPAELEHFRPLVCDLARVEGFERRNPERARHWLELAPDKTKLEWFLARAAVAYAENDWDQASASLRDAERIASTLPRSGAYDLDREDVAAYQRAVADARASDLALAA